MEQFDGFGQSSGMGKKPAIIVVDFMRGFTDTACPLGSNVDDEIEATKRLLDVAREKTIPILFTNIFYESHFKDGAHFIQKVPALKTLTANSEWIQIDPRLKRKDEVEPLITKKFASAFFGTSLHSILAFERIDTAIVVGCTTSGCVRATAVDALQYGYQVIVPKECVGDRSKQAHEANLYDIQTKYGDVVSVEDVISYIDQIRGDEMNV